LITKVNDKNVNYYVEKAIALQEAGDIPSAKEAIAKGIS
jgi:hypothetical protein